MPVIEAIARWAGIKVAPGTLRRDGWHNSCFRTGCHLAVGSRSMILRRDLLARWKHSARAVVGVSAMCATTVLCIAMVQDRDTPTPLAPLPEPEAAPNPEQVELGRLLFFDTRLSGDDTVSCATCHNPQKGWADGLPMSVGYPGSLYFRNTPTILNASSSQYLYWDGRLGGHDLATLVRDHIAEAHFMQADGRLVLERMRQVPEYERRFTDAFGGEPTYSRILNAVAAFVSTVGSVNVPFDRYLEGDENALSESAQRGLTLFQGKAGCIQCHDGPRLCDDRFHNLGLPPNQDIFYEPLRHITFRRFFRTLGLGEAAALRADPGLYAVTKQGSDWGRFRTPTLREIASTPPYMHDGSLATLEEVINFYDQGGGTPEHKDPLLQPLGLSDSEKADLIEFLKSLSGDPVIVEPPDRVEYDLRRLGDN